MEADFDIGTQMMGAVASLAGESPSRRPSCASPVLAKWFLAWADALGDDAGRQLAPYVEPLARSRGSVDDEVTRQWLVAEWLLGATLPACLDAIGAYDVARDLTDSSAVRSARDLAAVASFVDEASRVARRAHDGWRQATAALSGGRRRVVNRPPWRATATDVDEPCSAIWHVLGGAVEAAVDLVGALVTPAAAVLGAGGASPMPPALHTTTAVVTECLLAVAWSGCYRRLAVDASVWQGPVEEARHLGVKAAAQALRPLHVTLGRQAHEIASRMLAVTSHSAAGHARPGRPVVGTWAS